MSDKPQTTQTEQTTENTQTGRKPDLGAFNVKNINDDKAHWTKVGSAWSHKDGKGANIKLDSVPVDGVIVLRELRDEQMQQFEEQRQAQAEQTPQQSVEQSRNHEPTR